MLFKLLSKLPLTVLYGLSNVLYLVVYYLIPYRKAVVFKNLRNSFPGKEKAEITRIAKASYQNLADITVETIKAISIHPEELKKRVDFKNEEILAEFAKNQQSVILMTTHQCNWEWLLLAGCLKLPFPLDAVYKPLHNEKIDALMLEMRSRFGGNPISLKSIIVEMMKRKKTVRGFAIVADQTPLRDEEKYWTQFLNQDTAFAVGAEKIARFTKYPVVFVAMERVRRGYYQVSLTLLAQPPHSNEGYSLIEAYAREAEQHILQHPADWLWSYKKWKYKKSVYG